MLANWKLMACIKSADCTEAPSRKQASGFSPAVSRMADTASMVDLPSKLQTFLFHRESLWNIQIHIWVKILVSSGYLAIDLHGTVLTN